MSVNKNFSIKIKKKKMKSVVKIKPENGKKIEFPNESLFEITNTSFKIKDTTKNYDLYWDGENLFNQVSPEIYELPLIQNQTVYDNTFDIKFVSDGGFLFCTRNMVNTSNTVFNIISNESTHKKDDGCTCNKKDDVCTCNKKDDVWSKKRKFDDLSDSSSSSSDDKNDIIDIDDDDDNDDENNNSSDFLASKEIKDNNDSPINKSKIIYDLFKKNIKTEYFNYYWAKGKIDWNKRANEMAVTSFKETEIGILEFFIHKCLFGEDAIVELQIWFNSIIDMSNYVKKIVQTYFRLHVRSI